MKEIVRMSSKGQLVVPQSIRELEKLNPGNVFVAYPVDGGVLFRKAEIDVKEEFRNVSKEIEDRFKKLSKIDVARAVAWARKSS